MGLPEFISASELVEAAYILLVTVVTAVVAKRLLLYFKKSKKDWASVLADSLMAPSRLMIWVYGIMTALSTLFRHKDVFVFRERILQGRSVFAVAVASWLLFRFKSRFEKKVLKRILRKSTDRSDQALVAAAGKLMSIAVVTITILMILRILDVPLSGLLAVGGIGSLAISFASKDVIANFFGGLMLYINHPFSEGDWIKSPNKGFEGVVEHIGWYMTRIRTFARVPTFIPNALLTDAIVENPGRMYNRRIKATIGVRYDDFSLIRPIVDEIEAMLKAHSEIDQNQFLMVHFVEYGSYSLDLNVYCFTITTQWSRFRDIQQEIFLTIGEIIEKHGAEIAFPTRTLHMQVEKEPS